MDEKNQVISESYLREYFFLSMLIAVILFQIASLFASYILGYLTPARMQALLVTHMVRIINHASLPGSLTNNVLLSGKWTNANAELFSRDADKYSALLWRSIQT